MLGSSAGAVSVDYTATFNKSSSIVSSMAVIRCAENEMITTYVKPPARWEAMAERTKILVANPNSSTSMTDALKPLLVDLADDRLELEFYTAPPTAPNSINDAETSAASTAKTLPDLLKFLGLPEDPSTSSPSRYSAILIACYSAHPLTPLLRARVSIPVLNIFEASVIRARALGYPFGIVTTGKYWETALGEGIVDIPAYRSGCRDVGAGKGENFVGVRSTGLSAAELHSTAREEVDRRIIQASADLVREGAQVVLLGCAGMSGMEEAVLRGARLEDKEVQIVDGVRAGVEILHTWSTLE